MAAKTLKEIVDYIARFGGRCHDCADADGTCPSTKLPCDASEQRKIIERVIEAYQYGVKHGFITVSGMPDVDSVELVGATDAIKREYSSVIGEPAARNIAYTALTGARAAKFRELNK